jgi:hypothetical protein
MSGRANAALNLLHVGGAFVLQYATGLVIAQWPEVNGAYPMEAHQASMYAMLLLQVAALSWFVLAQIRAPERMAHAVARSVPVHVHRTISASLLSRPSATLRLHRSVIIPDPLRDSAVAWVAAGDRGAGLRSALRDQASDYLLPTPGLRRFRTDGTARRKWPGADEEL